MKTTTLTPVIMQSARFAGQSVQRERRNNIERALGKAPAAASAASLVKTAWKAARLEGEPAKLDAPRPNDCPFIGWQERQGWFVAASQNADGSWVVANAEGPTGSLKSLQDAECVSLPGRPERGGAAPRASQLIWKALWQRKAIFAEALLATFLVNTLALVTSIYSMQVYDRVIPNHGFQTLWVLTIGVVGALLLELMLKHVRSFAVEKTATRIDGELSEWFFERALGIRLECRPPTVGTLAAQIKGFELVRGVIGATSIFLLADVPFALFFIAVIGLIGGPMALVPLALLPISLATGLMFQRRISRHTRENQGGRWSRLVEEAGQSDYQIKHCSSISQNATVSLQQIGYVGLVAFGAYLVADNSLTMGALIACTIINGRALSPIAQLPGLMVQWAHARTAVAGLDKLISLPNEIDDQAHALTPGALDGGIRFDQAQFAYGPAADLALDIAKLEIKPGEKIGIVGAVGSGKSTLLKLASGLYRPAKGKVFLGGIDMAAIAPAFVREAIAF
ncbi:MAG: ATP-binding cassette domain-containing protein, partial [Betaproteobacteria bacterium]|nr:ATP-binding cassette domain-containing protein [Betaproteobacteria bacterium]